MNVKFVKYNSYRCPDYQISTSIVEENGKKYAIKKALTKEAYGHLNLMKERYEALQDFYNRIQITPVEQKDGEVWFDYIQGKTMGSILNDFLNQKENLVEKIKEFLEVLYDVKKDFLTSFESSKEFEKIFGAGREVLNGKEAYSYCNLDMIFDNFIKKEEDYYAIDYEWAFPCKVPVEFLKFHTLFMFYNKNFMYLSSWCSIEEFLGLFISTDFVEEYLAMEDHFQQVVHGKDRCYIYTNHYVKKLDNYQMKLEQDQRDISGLKVDMDVLRMEKDQLNNRISEMNQEIRQKDEELKSLREYQIAHPGFKVAVLQKCYGLARKILPNIVYAGLSVWANSGWSVFWYMVKNRGKNKELYQTWIEKCESDPMIYEELPYQPLISIVCPVYNVADDQLIACIESVQKQTYPNWELCLVDDCSTQESVRKVLSKYEGQEKIKIHLRKENGHISRATNDGIQMASGEFIALLDCDDLLTPNALYEMAKKLNENPSYDFIYSDEDKVDEKGKNRNNPHFKPDWSPDTMMSLMYTCHFSMFRKTMIEQVGGMRVGLEGSQDYDLVLRVMEVTNQIGHIPKILYHWRTRAESTANDMAAKPYILNSTIKAKEDALERRGLKGHLEFIESVAQYRVVYEPQNNPRVGIVIPSKDNYKVLSKCINTIEHGTKYRNFRIILVDNGSNEENRAKYEELCKPYGITYKYEKMDFNFSKMCNIGAAEATDCDYLLFLNDDIEIIMDEWLERMLGQAQVSYTGAVGAKLIYPNSNLIQHCGVVNYKVGPGHAFSRFDDNLNCYFGRNILDYNYSVVTGACLLLKKSVFEEIGGFNEDLPVAYNDVDLCFKLVEHGYYNVVRNDVRLIHHESVSRGYDDVTPEKAARQKREMAKLYELHPMFKNGYDPCYNPNLVGNSGDFKIDVESGLNKIYDLQSVNASSIPEAGESDGIKYSLDSMTQNDGLLQFNGWIFSDAVRNNKKKPIAILLEGDKESYRADLDKVFRMDLVNTYGKKGNKGFSGFECMVKETSMAPGVYQVYLIYQGKKISVKRNFVIA